MSAIAIIRFWTFLLCLIPSTVCSVFVLYHLLFDRTLRRALHNHLIIILLAICVVCQVTIYPWMLYFYDNGNYWERSLLFCSIWAFIDWGFYVSKMTLFAWTSIERHILIFHDRWLVTRKQRLLLHYLPPSLIFAYCLIFYSLMYLFPPCTNPLNYSKVLCVSACLYDNSVFNFWETTVNQLLPNLTIVVFSIALLVRVLRQNRRVRRRIQWRKHRKMTVQLLSISLIYLIFSFPSTFVGFLSLFGVSIDARTTARQCVEFFSYLLILFYPFVCLSPLPELRAKVSKLLSFRRRHRRVTTISAEKLPPRRKSSKTPTAGNLY